VYLSVLFNHAIFIRKGGREVTTQKPVAKMISAGFEQLCRELF
jgi:hypothetical protein